LWTLIISVVSILLVEVDLRRNQLRRSIEQNVGRRRRSSRQSLDRGRGRYRWA
jgi:hypothetical protein